MQNNLIQIGDTIIKNVLSKLELNRIIEVINKIELMGLHTAIIPTTTNLIIVNVLWNNINLLITIMNLRIKSIMW